MALNCLRRIIMEVLIFALVIIAVVCVFKGMDDSEYRKERELKDIREDD